MMDIKNLTNGVGQGTLSVQKNEKITKTVPVLKSNSTISLKKMSMMDFISFTNGVGGRGLAEGGWNFVF